MADITVPVSQDYVAYRSLARYLENPNTRLWEGYLAPSPYRLHVASLVLGQGSIDSIPLLVLALSTLAIGLPH